MYDPFYWYEIELDNDYKERMGIESEDDNESD
jgi:hypothetical protein